MFPDLACSSGHKHLQGSIKDGSAAVKSPVTGPWLVVAFSSALLPHTQSVGRKVIKRRSLRVLLVEHRKSEDAAEPIIC